jgi:hypothetical protein
MISIYMLDDALGEELPRTEPVSLDQEWSSKSIEDIQSHDIESTMSSVDIFSNQTQDDFLTQMMGAKPSGGMVTSSTSEFDPLVPKDWMMSFDSPAPLSKSESMASLKPNGLLGTPTVSSSRSTIHASTNGASLIDAFEPMSTPKSSLKYSQRDLDMMKNDLSASFDQEFQLAQTEIADLTTKLEKKEVEMNKIRDTLADWEKAVKSMISERENDRLETASRIKELEENVGLLTKEKDAFRREADEVTIKYRQVCVENADFKDVM